MNTNNSNHTHSQPKESSRISMEDIIGFINDFPALLWRIEIARSRIDFLNNNYAVAKGLDGKLLLKNIDYQRQVILSQDRCLVDAFMESVKNGVTAATIFRVHTPDESIAWLKLTGAPNSSDTRYYYGYLLNVDDNVEVLETLLRKESPLRLLVDNTENPALLADHDSLKMMCCNKAASDLFGLPPKNLKKITLNAIINNSAQQKLKSSLTLSRVTGRWAGTLDFKKHRTDQIFSAITVIRNLSYGEKRLFRVTVHAPRDEAQNKAHVTITDPKMRDALALKLRASQDDLPEILKTAFEHSKKRLDYDVLIFSDIYIRKNEVIVSHASDTPMNLQQGQKFPYKGTIAEDINRFDLRYMRVDDTHESIKPIDWALFIPQGIRSYFAKPFFSRQVLRTVLIVCSRKQNRFSDFSASALDDFFDPLCIRIKTWRRRQRS